MSIQISEATAPAPTVLASRAARLLAKILDVAAIIFICWALHFVITIGKVLLAFVLLVIVWDAFIPGRSPGKLLFKIAIASDSTLRPCSRIQAIGRNFMLFALPVVDWVAIFLGDRRRVADYLFGTIVVKRLHLQLGAVIPEPVSDGSDGSDDRRFFVTVATIYNPIEAQIVRGRTEAEGIPAFLADSHLAQTHTFIAPAIGWTKLQVRPDKMQQAREILQFLQAGDCELEE